MVTELSTQLSMQKFGKCPLIGCSSFSIKTMTPIKKVTILSDLFVIVPMEWFRQSSFAQMNLFMHIALNHSRWRWVFHVALMTGIVKQNDNSYYDLTGGPSVKVYVSASRIRNWKRSKVKKKLKRKIFQMSFIYHPH